MNYSINVPESVIVTVDKDQSLSVSFHDFVKTRLSDQMFGHDVMSIIEHAEALAILVSLHAGEEWILNELTYNNLKKATMEPSKPYNMQVALDFVVFMKAILDAKEKLK